MAILSNGRKKSSRVFQGKFGETWILNWRLDGARTSGLGFAAKAAKPGTHLHALRCTWVAATPLLVDPLLGWCTKGQYRCENQNACQEWRIVFLLQLPIWSYIVAGASLLAAVGALKLLSARRNKQVDKRRARAAAGILRMLNDEQVKRVVGIPPPWPPSSAAKVEHHQIRLRPKAASTLNLTRGSLFQFVDAPTLGRTDLPPTQRVTTNLCNPVDAVTGACRKCEAVLVADAHRGGNEVRISADK
jgi:hypothetical protein